MKYNMKLFWEQMIRQPKKKAMPVLSFPGMQLMGISVKELITSSENQAKAMQLVAQRTDSAASVSLMDLSVEAECFGSAIHVSEDEVPTVVGSIITDEDEADALQIPQVGAGRTSIYIDAIAKATQLITDRPVLAGVVGPFSLAARLMDVSESMILCYEEPDMVHTLLKKATAFLIEYCKAYKAVGANGVVVAEPVAGLLSPTLAAEFSAPYMKELVDAVQDDEFSVVYHNCGDYVISMIDSILSTGCAAYHFGNSIDMAQMCPLVPADVPVMGNVDPAGQFRNGTPASVREATLRVMENCCKFPNFIISSGCDIPPVSPWENIDAFFGAVEEFYNR